MTDSNEIDFVKPLRGPRIVRYISGVHMSLSHLGLTLTAKRLGIKMEKMDSGEFLVFMNAGQTAFKMLAPNNVLCYYRHPKNHRIDPRIICHIPRVFDGKELHMDKALGTLLDHEFKAERKAFVKPKVVGEARA